MLKQITSPQNSLIKDLILLRDKSRVRRKTKRFLIEGKREIYLAKSGGYSFDKIIFDPSLLSSNEIEELTNGASPQLIEVTNEVYQKLAYRSSTEGIIAVAISKELTIDTIKFKNNNPLVLIAEAPEKPGNIGALLRTADAAKVDAVLIANPKTDMYNPNIIRSSVGCIFTNTIATGSTSEIINYLKGQNINIYCAALKDDSENYALQDFSTATAIVVGTEATGLTNEWLSQSTKNIIIPMLGQIDSMNVSVSAGILIYEAKRQRNFK